MAGSLSHIVDKNGNFTMDLIENLGDAHEALEECFVLIRRITGGSASEISKHCRACGFSMIKIDMKK